MASYLILGGGKFGSLALSRLAQQDTAAKFLVVDCAPDSLVMKTAGLNCQRVQIDVIDFLVQHLEGGEKWDWLVPMVPVHIAYHWLLRGPLAGSGWQPAAVPEALAHLVPWVLRGPDGELYLSRAQHLCPDDCPESGICPVTGEPRDLPLHQELASVKLSGYQIRVIPSQHLAPGVGGYPPQQLLDLARELKALTGNVLIITACLCQGVVHGLARRSGRQSV